MASFKGGRSTTTIYSSTTVGITLTADRGAYVWANANTASGTAAELANFNLTLSGFANGAQPTTISGAGTGRLVIGGDELVIIPSNGSIVISAGIASGSGHLTLAPYGSGNVTLSGSNAHSGGTSLHKNTLNINNANALGTGTFAIAAGSIDNNSASAITLSTNNAQVWSSDFTFAGTQNLDMGTGTVSLGSYAGATRTVTVTANTLTIGGRIIDGSHADIPTTGLTKAGAGTLALGGSNTYSGSTSITAGTLQFSQVAALNASSGVGLAAGSILDYTGASTGTLSRNVTVTSSGTGTIRNSGGQTLTLSGTLTKDGKVLRLTGGQFDVTGQIVGASANSDLLVDGTSTVTLSATNSYNGPTFVNQASRLVVGIDNAIPNNSTVTLGDATTTGTLSLGTFSDAIGGLVFSDSGGTVAMAANKTAAVQLSSTSALTLGANAGLDLTGMATSAGLYRLVSAPSITDTFGSVTGLSSNYVLRYGTVNANEIDAQRKAEQSFTMSTGTITRALVNTNVAVNGSLTNSTPTGGSDLAVSLSSGGVLTVTGLGSGTNSLAPQASTSVTGTIQTGATAGTQTWSVINTDNSAIQTTSTASGSLQVVNQRTFSVSNSGTLNLGNFLRTSAVSGSATISSSGLSGTTANATLGSFSGTNANGFSLGLASGTNVFDGLLATQEAIYSLSGSAASAGAINGSFTSIVSAEFGSIDPVTVSLVGTAYDAATASLASGGSAVGNAWTVDLGQFNQGSGTSTPWNFSISNLLASGSFTADLVLDTFTTTLDSGAIFMDLTGTSSFPTLVAGGTNPYTAWMSLANSGTFTNTYSLVFGSAKDGQSLGGPQSVTLTVTGKIVASVPEPGTLALAGIGIAAAAWARRRRR